MGWPVAGSPDTVYMIFTCIAFFYLFAYRRRIGRDEGRPLLSDAT